MINTSSHIHFQYNPNTDQVDYVKYDNQNVFNKSENSQITIQKLNISYDDAN